MENAGEILECVREGRRGQIQPFGGYSLQQCVTVLYRKRACLIECK